MKKGIALFFALLVVFSLYLYACGNGDSYNSKTPSTNSSDNAIKSIVVNALYKEIDSKYDTADAGSCKFKINKTEEKNGYIYVYGSVTLYDQYGKTTGGWRDGSGTPYRNFTVKIDAETGRVSSCEIN